MKFSINIDVELTKIEVSFIKKHFVNNKKTHNRFFFSTNNEDRRTLDNLSKHEVVYFDNMGNIHLTIIGNNIIDMLDRDKKINDILK